MTDNREITDLGIRALAAFVADQRPDWDAPGVVAALRAEREHYDAWQLAAAMIRRAADPANLTPRLQTFDGEGGFVACRRHPGAPVRTDGCCGVCFAEAHESDEAAYFDRRPRPASV